MSECTSWQATTRHYQCTTAVTMVTRPNAPAAVCPSRRGRRACAGVTLLLASAVAGFVYEAPPGPLTVWGVMVPTDLTGGAAWRAQYHRWRLLEACADIRTSAHSDHLHRLRRDGGPTPAHAARRRHTCATCCTSAVPPRAVAAAASSQVAQVSTMDEPSLWLHCSRCVAGAAINCASYSQVLSSELALPHDVYGCAAVRPPLHPDDAVCVASLHGTPRRPANNTCVRGPAAPTAAADAPTNATPFANPLDWVVRSAYGATAAVGIGIAVYAAGATRRRPRRATGATTATLAKTVPGVPTTAATPLLMAEPG